MLKNHRNYTVFSRSSYFSALPLDAGHARRTTNTPARKLLFCTLFLLGLAATGCSTKSPIQKSENTLSAGYAPSVVNQQQFNRRFYAAIGLGPSRMEPDTSGLAGDVNDRIETGGQIGVGIDLGNRLSLEAHAADIGSAGISSGGRINYHPAGASVLVYGLNRKANRDRRTGLSAFGRIGVGQIENTPHESVDISRSTETHMLAGVGVEYARPSGLGLRAEFIQFRSDAQYTQATVLYRFGKSSSRHRSQLTSFVEEPARTDSMVAEQDTTAQSVELVFGTVNFSFDSAELTSSARLVLTGIAATLKNNPDISAQLLAHTDSLGSDDYNQSLSRQRAESVQAFLDATGIDQQRLSVVAHGESQPVEDNSSADGRAKNRRVEIMPHP